MQLEIVDGVDYTIAITTITTIMAACRGVPKRGKSAKRDDYTHALFRRHTTHQGMKNTDALKDPEQQDQTVGRVFSTTLQKHNKKNKFAPRTPAPNRTCLFFCLYSVFFSFYSTFLCSSGDSICMCLQTCHSEIRPS